MEEDKKILAKISEKITEDKDYLILSWKRLRTKNNEADANLWLRGFLLSVETLKKVFGEESYIEAAETLVFLPTNHEILKYISKYL